MRGASSSSPEPTSNGSTSTEKSKLQEQTTGKGELSYSYWAKDSLSPASVEPKKLTEEEKAELDRHARASGASAWNAAGTFEERGATEWAKARLTELLKGLQLSGVTVSDVNSVTGDANIFIVRGKKRCGFDFEMQLAWRAIPRPDAVEVRGHCKVLNFSSDDPEDMVVEPEVGHRQPERRADEEASLAMVKKELGKQLQLALWQLLDELKQK